MLKRKIPPKRTARAARREYREIARRLGLDGRIRSRAELVECINHPPARDEASTVPVTRTTIRDAVLEFLATTTEPVSPPVVAEHVGWDASYVTQVLSALSRQGRTVRVRRGLYSISEAVEREVAS